MGAMTISEGTIDLACGVWPKFWLAVFRVGVFSEMTKEGMIRGTSNLREERIARQYNEVADELVKLQNIICSVTDFQA